ncbi:MAG: nucleotide sugar dehydrogenase [Pseudomonadota bacterium]
MSAISIFGIGYVGVVAAACLTRDGHRVIAVDIDPGKVQAINEGKSPIVEAGLAELIAAGARSGQLTATTDAKQAVLETDASFICVGTPSDADGSVGLNAVISACRDIGAALADKSAFHSVIVRSTIVPRTTERVCVPTLEEYSGKSAGADFGAGYFPEFLREGSAIADYDDPGLIVYGALDAPTFAILDRVNAPLRCIPHRVSIPTAEMVKYTSNSWRAVKVSFANEIGNIAKSCGLDGQEVMQIMCSDRKVNTSSTFMRPGFAFGGSCLPKDVRALRHLAARNEIPAPLLEAVLEANNAQIALARRMVGHVGARRIGLVGIAFKPGTDDLRESPLATLAGQLISDGHAVQIYDPFVSEAFRKDAAAAGRGNTEVEDLEGRLVGDVAELIGSSEAIIVGNIFEEARAPLMDAMDAKPMVDLTRLSPGRATSGSYAGICW